jgi:tRNA nucleotidyltransferase (CCA-adding enzyme)
VSQYITRLRHLELDVGGQDLKELGLKPGPRYAEILRKILAAKIDGAADCRADQLELMRHLALGTHPLARDSNDSG